MNTSPNNEKIERYLNELADEYKVLLYKALLERSKSLDDLSVSELLRLDNEIKKPLFENYQKKQKRRRILITAGIFYMFAGFTLYLMTRIFYGDYLYNTEDLMSLISAIIGIVGLGISVFACIFPTVDRTQKNESRQDNLELLEYEVVMKWRELEGVVNDINTNTDIKTNRSILEFLLSNQFIDKNEYNTLKSFLQLRNSIVHSDTKNYSPEKVNELLHQVDHIIEKFKKIV